MSEREMSEEEYLRQQEEEIRLAQNQSNANPYMSAMLGGGMKQNLVEWQLDFTNELKEIERLLKSDVYDCKKNDWVRNPDQDKVLMNDVGVSDMLRFIFTLVNKNKVLSNYSPEEVNERVKQIKHELRVQIYLNYEKYGMDNEYKMNNYSMIVLIIGSLIEDAYKRSMGGEERRGLNEARMVTQSDPVIPNSYNFYPQQQQKKGLISKMMPWNWGKG